MGTRSVIMVTGKAAHGEGHETVRLYRHWDGDPRWVIPAIVGGIERANSLVFDWNSKSFNKDRQVTIRDVRAKVFADCVIAGSISFYRGFDIDYDDPEDGEPTPPIFREPFGLERCGNQGDLEWMYVVDVVHESLKVYGNGSCPATLLEGGPTDPASAGADFKKEEYRDAYVAATKAEVDRLMELGWNLNDRLSRPRRRRKTAVAR